ncbi:MAG: hypothetical protein JSW16_08345 [Dehalococcoidales bacterium]|nr:MAG: hypothetical protein JSW16_08345 [Dehalococcoidales bacterium]
MMWKRILFPLVLVLAVVSIVAPGCSEPEFDLTPIELVPQRASMIAGVQVSQIIEDPDLKETFAGIEKDPDQPQTFDEAIQQMVEETGLDLRDISRILVFGDITSLEQTDYVGLIAEGDFDEEQMIGDIEDQTGEKFTTGEYKGYTLYQEGFEEYSIVFLSEKMLISGTTEAIEDAIDVSKGIRDKASGTLIDTYNQLGNPLVKAVIELPEEAWSALDEEPAMGDFPLSMEAFSDIDILGLSFDKEGEIISIEITPHFLSTDSAQDARNTLSGAISIFRGTLDVPELKDLLGKIEVRLDDSWLTIVFEITQSEIEQLMETFQSDFLDGFE